MDSCHISGACEKSMHCSAGDSGNRLSPSDKNLLFRRYNSALNVLDPATSNHLLRGFIPNTCSWCQTDHRAGQYSGLRLASHHDDVHGQTRKPVSGK